MSEQPFAAENGLPGYCFTYEPCGNCHRCSTGSEGGEAVADATREAEAWERAADALDDASDTPDDPRWTASLLGYHGEAEWLRARAQEMRDTPPGPP